MFIDNDDTVETSVGNVLEQSQEESEESHIIYPKDEEVTYMVPVPKNGSSRDTILTHIPIMVVYTIGLKKSGIPPKV